MIVHGELMTRCHSEEGQFPEQKWSFHDRHLVAWSQRITSSATTPLCQQKALS